MNEVARNWVEELAFEVALEYFTPEDLQLKYELPPALTRRSWRRPPSAVPWQTTAARSTTRG